MSGLIIFGPAEEKAATSGAGLVCRIVSVLEILAVGFLLENKYIIMLALFNCEQ